MRLLAFGFSYYGSTTQSAILLSLMVPIPLLPFIFRFDDARQPFVYVLARFERF
jgi:hypothetical protein